MHLAGGTQEKGHVTAPVLLQGKTVMDSTPDRRIRKGPTGCPAGSVGGPSDS